MKKLGVGSESEERYRDTECRKDLGLLCLITTPFTVNPCYFLSSRT